MKRLLVLTIIACVSLNAHARRDFFGDRSNFKEFLKTYYGPQKQSSATKEDNSKKAEIDKIRETSVAAKETAATTIEIERMKEAANIEIKQMNEAESWRSLSYNAKQARMYEIFNTDKGIVASERNMYRNIAKSNAWAETRSVERYNRKTDYIDEQKAIGEMDAAREAECVNKIDKALNTYGRLALLAIGTSWVRNCPQAEQVIGEATVRFMNEEKENYEYGLVANGGWFAEDYTRN